jgi:spoIIIJ-associated protein
LDGQQRADHRANEAHKNESGSGYARRSFSLDAGVKKEEIKPDETVCFQLSTLNHPMPAQPKETLETILTSLGFPATVEEQKLEEGVLLDVKTDDAGRLIGRQGQTLSDLQYITNRLLFQQDASAPKVMVDVGGYRAQAREALVKKAKDAAEKVRRWGDTVELEPMTAFDRRVVHQALKDDPDVETHSVEVDGTDKKAILLRPRH